jgi:hypothetical protein
VKPFVRKTSKFLKRLQKQKKKSVLLFSKCHRQRIKRYLQKKLNLNESEFRKKWTHTKNFRRAQSLQKLGGVRHKNQRVVKTKIGREQFVLRKFK